MHSKFALLGLTIAMVVQADAKTMITKSSFGKTPDGTSVDLYTLTNGKLKASITTFGGRVVTLDIPDKAGHVADVVLGFDSINGYTAKNPYFGALIGRYGNRIGHAQFTLDGHTYHLPNNDNGNTLHGGTKGFDSRVWTGRIEGDSLVLTYVSKDGEEGFPGTLTATVRYTLGENELKIEYAATTDKPTVLNLTNHSYFNLAGQGNGDILNHQITIAADKFTPVDKTLIPTGELRSVSGTPFDFRTAHPIGARINAKDQQIEFGGGYDHNWVLNGSGMRVAATAYEPTSGRFMEVLTDQPGLQFYTGNFLDGTLKGKGGKVYNRRSAFCMETQHFPDSPNKPSFPSTELKPGQRYHTTTIFRFSTR